MHQSLKYIYIYLLFISTKCITITNEAYERLKSLKSTKESFSDVVNKLTKKSSFYDLIGVLSNGEAKELRENIKELRKRMNKDMGKRLKKYDI